MAVAALIISILAFAAAGWSAWGTHRQAAAAEVQEQSAAQANATAEQALELAQQAEARESSRQHVEERPDFEVKGRRSKTKPLLTEVTVSNNGPVAYDAVSVCTDDDDPETARLVHGMAHAESLKDVAELGALKPGESLTTGLVRTDAELQGKAKVLVTARREGREWISVHYVSVTRPPRMYSF